MATDTSPRSATPTADRPLVPPEERFWKRYSPHNEAPLSGAGSLTIHLLIAAVILFGLPLLVKLTWTKQNKPLPIDVVRLAGGGGNPKAVGGGPGAGALDPLPPEDPGPQRKKDPAPSTPSTPPKLEVPNQTLPPPLPDLKDNAHVRALLKASGDAEKELFKVSKETQDKLLRGLAPAGQGAGGSGDGGGRGTGQGPGTGSNTGDGRMIELNERQKRVLRWTMIFTTYDGNDYRKQLQGLDAILAIPMPNDPNRFWVIRNLTPPVKRNEEDLSQIGRIFWWESRPESIAGLLGALGLPVQPLPPRIAAFFPEELERELVRKELEFAHRRYPKRSITEDDIAETRFEVFFRGGRYVPQVKDQKMLRP
jgi:hypothetical protein